MTSDELKKKIVEVVLNSEITGIQIRAITGGVSTANSIADALIAAGLRFGENLTATFDHMALEREHELERRLAEAERHADVAEKKYRIALTNYAKLHRKVTHYNKMTTTYDAEITEQAEEELNKESKD